MRARSLILLILLLASILILADSISSLISHQQDLGERIEQIGKEVRTLRQELAIYKSAHEDLSIAFINHHGTYPRRIKNASN